MTGPAMDGKKTAVKGPASVVLVDDHALVISGMRDLVNTSGIFEVTGEFLNGDDALNAMDALQPDLVMLDLRLGSSLGPEMCRGILKKSPSSRIIILTGFADGRILSACLDEGASGLLLKASWDLDIVDVMRRVLAGERVVDPSIEALVSGHGHTRALTDSDGFLYGDLRTSEYRVLRLMAQGLSTKEIQAELDLTTNTVRSYAQTLMEKLNVHSRVQLVVKARALRLI